MKQILPVSVQNLVGFVLQSGDLSGGAFVSARLADGVRGHRELQALRSSEHGEAAGPDEAPAGTYRAEVPLSARREYRYFTLEVTGRADGVFTEPDGTVMVEEIKTVPGDPAGIESEGNPLHWAQAMCYAAMLSQDGVPPGITIRLTYYGREGGGVRSFHRTCGHDELSRFFADLADRYADWAELLYLRSAERNASIAALEFPFPAYRPGQRSFAAQVYRTVRDGKRLFAEAPTGIGKTAAALFPALKALGEGLTSRIFYLTAKTTTRTVVEQTLSLLRERGLSLTSITLTAKEKICPVQHDQAPDGGRTRPPCAPGLCRFAEGYYDRLEPAMRDIMREKAHFSRETILRYAERHSLCPFEFSLDIALWCDLIVCDYNYLFDPGASLKRFFLDRGGEYTFLIDEAHNLPERAREMFSAELEKRSVLELKKLTSGEHSRLSRLLGAVNAAFLELGRTVSDGQDGRSAASGTLPEPLADALRTWTEAYEAAPPEPAAAGGRLLEFYFRAAEFLRAAGQFDERYVTLIDKTARNVRVKLFCLDPSALLEKSLRKGRAAVFFSATLSPPGYFRRLLSAEDSPVQTDAIALPSPFPRENLCIVLDPSISTRYRDREAGYRKIAERVAAFVRARPGNYLVFFPSYRYLDAVYELTEELLSPGPAADTEDGPDVTAASHGTRPGEVSLVRQSPGMSERERERFIDSFGTQNPGTLVGFAVSGGVFAEGIDLAGERLSGAVVIGVGLPQVSPERETIRAYFDRVSGQGFEFGYAYSGMNRVLQAAGRVIRTETDRGAVLLIDQRFSMPFYERLFPRHWHPVPRIRTPAELERTLAEFWNR